MCVSAIKLTQKAEYIAPDSTNNPSTRNAWELAADFPRFSLTKRRCNLYAVWHVSRKRISAFPNTTDHVLYPTSNNVEVLLTKDRAMAAVPPETVVNIDEVWGFEFWSTSTTLLAY